MPKLYYFWTKALLANIITFLYRHFLSESDPTQFLGILGTGPTKRKHVVATDLNLTTWKTFKSLKFRKFLAKLVLGAGCLFSGSVRAAVV